MSAWTQPLAIEWSTLALRMTAAAVLPFAIGFERFRHRKPIDFRPFVIISIAACALMIAALALPLAHGDDNLRMDPVRVIEGVITGIGFIGAGAMFREGNFVQGAGSAASIWCAGVIGVLCGIGHLLLAAILAALVVALLLASRPFTEKWDPDKRNDS